MSHSAWKTYESLYFPEEKIIQPTKVEISSKGAIEFEWSTTPISQTRVMLVLDRKENTAFLYNRKPKCEMTEYSEITQDVFDKLRGYLNW